MKRIGQLCNCVIEKDAQSELKIARLLNYQLILYVP
jgi:hypothetical protein